MKRRRNENREVQVAWQTPDTKLLHIPARVAEGTYEWD